MRLHLMDEMDDFATTVKEDGVERILHPEAVNALAALNQQSITRRKGPRAEQPAPPSPHRSCDATGLDQLATARLIPRDQGGVVLTFASCGHNGPRITTQ